MKLTVAVLLLLLQFAFPAVACWYSKSSYTDYIFAINQKQVIYTNLVDNVMQYTVTNNIVQDFPITVSMKLISDTEVVVQTGSTTNVPELIMGKLQYRVLPNGRWTTVEEYNTKSGSIQRDSAPATYFGKNNIWPQGCKAGDAVMIRLYVTDGMWQSGDLESLCTNKLTEVRTEFGNVISLPDQLTYKLDGRDVLSFNLGGNWFPHLAVTIIYSGKDRPAR